MKKSVSYVEQIRTLIKLDIDASRAYSNACENREVPAIHRRLTGFRADHERHVLELSQLIRELGEEPPTPIANLSGYLMKKITSLRLMPAIGNEARLRVMRRSERMTVALYRKALECDLPREISEVLEQNLKDEERHLHYLDALLERRPWDVPHSSNKALR